MGSTISSDSNDSLAGISDFSVEDELEKGSDYSHVGSESCESGTDTKYVQEPSKSVGNRRGRKIGNVTQKVKEKAGERCFPCQR